MNFRIFGPSAKPVQYASNATRFISMDVLLGGAEFQEHHDLPVTLPIDSHENLEARFNSGVNRTDIPRMWGYPAVDRKLGEKRFSLADELDGWRRINGMPVHKK